MEEREIFVPEFDHETGVAVGGWESEGGLPFKPALFSGIPTETTHGGQILEPKKPDPQNPNRTSQ